MTSIVAASSIGLFVDGREAALGGTDVTSLAPFDGGWMAVTDRSTVHMVTGGFEATPIGAASGEVDSIAWVDGNALAGVADARLEIPGENPVRDRTFDAAPGRDEWYTPWGGPPAVRSLDQGPDGLRWVNVHVGGVLVGDGGRWHPTMAIDQDVHQVIADPVRPGAAWCAAAVGLGWTVNGGESWSWTDEGMAAPYARAVAVTGDTVYVSGSRGPGGGRGTLYRGVRGGPLEPCAGPFAGNIDTAWIAARDDVVALLTPDGAVMVSTDRGDSWEERFAVDGPRAVLLAP